MLDFLERGPLMDDVSGDFDGGGGAIADAPDTGGEESTALETTDTGEVHDAEFVDQSGTQDTALVKAGERAVVNGKITPSGRAAIEAVKALSPSLAQGVVQAMLQRDWFMKEFPGGKKEIEQLRKLAQSHGGEEGISELRSIATQMEEIDRMYDAKDPGFIDKITDNPQGQANFVGLMPYTLQKFAKLAPQHFAHESAKNFEHLLTTAGMPTMFATQAAILNRAASAYKGGNLELAASFLAEIIDNHNSIHGVVQKIHDQAATEPPAFGVQASPQLDERTRALETKEKQLQRQEWESLVSGKRRETFGKAWAELTKGRNLTSDQQANVKGFYELRLTAKIRQWQNQADRFISGGDKDGYLREQFTFFTKAIPEALRQALAEALPGKPGPKITPTTPTRPGQPLKPPVAGVTRVAKMPPTNQIDVVRTSSAMLSENKAFTKDGKIIQWDWINT